MGKVQQGGVPGLATFLLHNVCDDAASEKPQVF
jgi:hypothetical protein